MKLIPMPKTINTGFLRLNIVKNSL